jgi:hypothetical protein
VEIIKNSEIIPWKGWNSIQLACKPCKIRQKPLGETPLFKVNGKSTLKRGALHAEET